MKEELKGKAISIRHRHAGVFFGYICDEGMFDGLIKIEGRRVWSWNGGRLEMSQVSKKGLTERDLLGEWEFVEINMKEGLIEIREIEPKILESAKKLPAANV